MTANRITGKKENVIEKVCDNHSESKQRTKVLLQS